MSIIKNISILFCAAVPVIGHAQCCNHNGCMDYRDSCRVGERCAPAYSPSTLLIWYDASSRANKKRLLKAVRDYKAQLLYDYKNFNGIAIKIPGSSSLEDAIGFFKKVRGVLQVSRDGIMTIQDS